MILNITDIINTEDAFIQQCNEKIASFPEDKGIGIVSYNSDRNEYNYCIFIEIGYGPRHIIGMDKNPAIMSNQFSDLADAIKILEICGVYEYLADKTFDSSGHEILINALEKAGWRKVFEEKDNPDSYLYLRPDKFEVNFNYYPTADGCIAVKNMLGDLIACMAICHEEYAIHVNLYDNIYYDLTQLAIVFYEYLKIEGYGEVAEYLMEFDILVQSHIYPDYAKLFKSIIF